MNTGEFVTFSPDGYPLLYEGTAYTYPTWIQLVFGQTLVFDRRDEKEGTPLEGKRPEAVTQTSVQR